MALVQLPCVPMYQCVWPLRNTSVRKLLGAAGALTTYWAAGRWGHWAVGSGHWAQSAGVVDVRVCLDHTHVIISDTRGAVCVAAACVSLLMLKQECHQFQNPDGGVPDWTWTLQFCLFIVGESSASTYLPRI